VARRHRAKKPAVCRICRKRQPWHYKNGPPGVCKRCYHTFIWADRPEVRAARETAALVDGLPPAQLDEDNGRADEDFDLQRARATSAHLGP
jgi:hypothetical protein